MAESPLRTETRTDAAGTYTAYIYADGHVETEPAGRPQNREDLQRKRKTEFAQQQARQVVEAGTTGRAAKTPAAVRQALVATSLRPMTWSFHEGLASIQDVPKTLQMSPDGRAALVSTFSLNGTTTDSTAIGYPA